ncbi:hypothetical protein BCR41DRAFT_310987 [Lobosporangium transversale]|uniref:NodB homology domain-containing protein n=1 Tax=Lobosporangium transversale TaxID=64571 RepID=A0A1Y2GCY0_9FUNG|nr:hypothetical protein BCR41DRAFT_310987 [Lobosporangium transversale]ORZ07290.1 hypothetical protein BCR41DRAFT_310987 [Lobosporangium transversale]|eukprot:XP_021877953.1 hypothetical protein BCR41DRAFT_310987 [Lobosporangium transversale]
MPGVVALTFDDGPGPYNDQLLKLLAEKGVKATFYVIGSMVAENPQQAGALKKILDGGHMLASHSYSHSNMDTMNEEQLKKEIQMTSDIMFQNAGVRPAYMRPPEGRCGELCTKVMESMGLVISHWNVDTNDWRFKALAPETAAVKSMTEINSVILPGNPATDSFILLEHEIHKFSVDLLAGRLIDAILAKGYKFVTMDVCVGKPAYLPGSTIPSAASNPINGTSGAVPPAVTSGAVPSVEATADVTAKAATGGNSNTQDNSAGFVQVGAWAMGLTAVLGYAFF